MNMPSRVGLACLLALAATGNAAARTSTPKIYASEATRNIVGGRKVLVLMPTSIRGTYDNAALEAAALLVGGRLLEKLAAEGNVRRMTEEADLKIRPLRAALAGFDFDKPMRAALIPVLESSTWVRAQDIEFTPDESAENTEKELDNSTTRQMLTVNARCYADPAFRSLGVSIESTILVRKIPKGHHGEIRLTPDYIPFTQLLRAIVYLPDSDHATPEENLARWSADHGRLARQALDIAIPRASALFAQNLDATKESAAIWSKRGNRKTVTQFHLLGWVIRGDADSIVFFSPRDDALNHIGILKP